METLNDLQVGMIPGRVGHQRHQLRCLRGYRASGRLVHLSLADKFVEDPHTVVKAGDIVKVKVMEVDLQRKRIALSMRRMSSRAFTAPRRQRQRRHT